VTVTDPASAIERRARRERILSLFLDQTLRRGRSYWWRPRGLSMSPTILDGERVLISPADPRRLRIGHIVKFSVDGRLILHRLVARRRRSDGALVFTFRGDNGSETDAHVPSSSIIGIAVAVERDENLITLCSFSKRLSSLFRIALGRCIRH
jgi:peptidase S24-like protein